MILAESGGVRLHEANAGLIGVSEVMRALLDLRASGIPSLVLIGGRNGCFGGMGIVARCVDTVIMSDIGRLAMSGPEVIEASHGVEEFDSRDRALVWRTTGGKHGYLCGDCDVLVEDDVEAFRIVAIASLAMKRPLTLEKPRGRARIAFRAPARCSSRRRCLRLLAPDRDRAPRAHPAARRAGDRGVACRSPSRSIAP